MMSRKEVIQEYFKIEDDLFYLPSLQYDPNIEKLDISSKDANVYDIKYLTPSKEYMGTIVCVPGNNMEHAAKRGIIKMCFNTPFVPDDFTFLSAELTPKHNLPISIG